MVNRKTNLKNFFRTTTTSSIGPTSTVYPVETTVGGPISPAIIIIDPENPDGREVILADGAFTATQFSSQSVAGRDLDGSGFLTHPAGVTVWVSVLAQHINDLNDRVDAALTGLVTEHDQLIGLADDDHPIYLTNGRFDIRHNADTHLQAQVQTSAIQTWSFAGDLELKTGKSRWYPPYNVTVFAVTLALGTATTGSNARVDVKKNGTTTKASPNYTIGAGANYSSNIPDGTKFDLVGNTDYVTVDIVGIGATTPGADLVVTLHYRRKI